MTENTFFQALLQAFSHTPTPSQHTALQLFSSYLFDPEATEKLFLLKGFAGTGKTSITNALIAALPLISHHSVLLAPTGRAAKVMTFFTHQPAFTIHKYIYYHRTEGGELAFTLRPNKAQRTLFIVDEASMIADNEGVFGSRSLLDDLMRFVYSGTDCKLLLIGDAAQLPPVHTHGSPALNIAHLEYQYQKEVVSTQLTDVVRQRRRSGILRNATALRKTIFGNTSQPYFQFRIGKSADLIRLYNGEEIQEALVEAYDNYGSDETTIIVRANKRAVDWNQQVRRVILDTEDEIEVGDLLM
ncbi:MAG: AAA family ATPase, partial [Capnocytophaga sp.]